MRRTENDENSLIRRIRQGLAAHSPARLPGLRLGIGDDAALWNPTPGCEIVLTCDWFLEGTHFRRSVHPADSVGWKCLARALSDIAAMGGRPRCFLLSLALPQSHTGKWLDSFLTGLHRASRKFKCIPAGGDTTLSKKILISVTAVGEVTARTATRRCGARSGDLVCVSGQLGDAQLGLERVTRDKSPARRKDQALERHLYPTPRMELARQLAKSGLVTSMMDLSDGLSIDLRRLCGASGVGAAIEESKLPLAKGFRQQNILEEKRLWAALHGGDDYELLFTVPRKNLKRLPPEIAGVPLTVIGEIQRGSKIFLVKPGGRRIALEMAGWDPFRRTTKRP